jgi:hypothetical protein
LLDIRSIIDLSPSIAALMSAMSDSTQLSIGRYQSGGLSVIDTVERRLSKRCLGRTTVRFDARCISTINWIHFNSLVMPLDTHSIKVRSGNSLLRTEYLSSVIAQRALASLQLLDFWVRQRYGNDEVLGFFSGEGGGLDTECGADFIAEPPF